MSQDPGMLREFIRGHDWLTVWWLTVAVVLTGGMLGQRLGWRAW